MPTLAAATPLLSLDAVALDTETTGLDPRSARIVQIGAVRIEHGRLVEDATFSRLVATDAPIPARATAVHGIAAATLADAPGFAAIWEEFSRFAEDRVAVGHAIGFDLAVLRRECALAGLAFVPPRALDTSLLARLVNPRLADFSLEAVAAWLEIDPEGRHTGLGDARTAARIFLALLPALRERGIRTLAEAEAACRRFAQQFDDQHKAGWLETPGEPRPDPDGFARIDAYPYRHRVRDVMSSPPAVIAPGTALSAAVAEMMTKRRSSLFVAGDEEGDHGILTERDVLRAIARCGADALSQPAASFASRPLITVPDEAFVYRAIGRMTHRRIRHLGVVDESGRLVGAASARDLLRLRAGEAVSLGDEIDAAPSRQALAKAWARIPAVAKSLIAEAVPSADVAAVISREIGAMTRRAAILAEEIMAAEGLGPAPAPFAVLVLGSAGRGESLIAADQDNALVHADGPDEAAQAWFASFGDHLARILDEAGILLCKGGVMASNAAWRGSLADWRQRVGHWISRSEPADLLNVDIFFDLRPVHGDWRLAADLRDHAYAAARDALAFAKLLAEQAVAFEPPLGLFGGIRTEDGRVDLKKGGLFPIVSAVRALAIRHGVAARSTPERLDGLRKRGLAGSRDLAALSGIHGRLLGLVLAQQIEDVEAGLPPSNAVRLKSLDRERQASLRRDLAALGRLPDLVRDLMF